MNRWTRLMLGVALGVAAFGSYAQSCTVTINPGTDLVTTIQNNAVDSVICLNPGTYTAPPSGGVVFPANGAFAIGKRVIVKGLGAGPANTILQASAASADHTVYFLNYLGGGFNTSGAQLLNVTIQGSQGGVQIQNFTASPAGRLTDIKLKDVVITTTAGGAGFGVKSQSGDRIVLDNVTIGSQQTAINFIDTYDSLVMNSTVTATGAEAAAALAVLAGGGNRFINNTLGGSPRNSAADPYSFNGGGVVFYNTSGNRFEGNIVQGMRDDAVDFTIANIAGNVDSNNNPLQLLKPLNNYVGKNQVIHSDFNLHGTTAGSSGIWANCASDATWIFGNEIRNTAECGVCVWGSKSNMVLGNNIRNNGITGMFVSGGQEALDDCQPAGNLTFRQKPTNNYLQSNAAYFNRNDQMNVRNADSTVIARNFLSPNNGFNGTAQGCTNPACQAAFSIETDGSAFGTSTGTQILANTSVNNLRGLWADYATVTGIEFYLNRIIGSTNSRWVTASTQNIDRGNILGGNQWSQHIPTGNPSSGQPYTGVFHNASNQTGNVVDRFPYQSEDLGRGYNITVLEPRASSSVARGTRRTVRWDSIGCFWIDLSLGGVALATNTPNTGYAIVDIPASGATGNANIAATCKDRLGNTRATANSPTFALTSNTLQLVAPGRDDTFNAGQTNVWVAWKNTNRATNSTVFIEYSSDGGASWPSLLATISNQNTTTANVSSALVTIPAGATAYGMIRVRSSASVVDNTDGVFAVRSGAGALTNVSAGRQYLMGQSERLEWSSPPNSRLVDITATSGNTMTVASNLPDRGYYDWIVPAFSSATTLSITVTFKNDTGGILSSTTTANSGFTKLPTMITFGNPPGLGPGQSGVLPVSASSNVGVTLTSNTPGVCTVSGSNTINFVANGTCTVTANAPASGNFAAALPSQLSFVMGQTQTISFNAPDYLVVGASITLSATASSGLAVTFTSLTPSVCSVAGTTLTGNSVGTCTVAANQPGGGSFGAAPQVTDNLQAVAGANLPRLVNISTRMQVLTGENVMIGGFILGGTTPKNVVIRARGPSLTALGVPGALANPVLQLFSGPTMIDSNDNWQSHPNAVTLQNAGFGLSDPFEAGMYKTIGPGAFTAIVSGAGGGTGVGLIEVFEVDGPEKRLINISTRGQVLTGSDVMIAGFIIQGQAPQTVVVRARGPSLAAQGVAGVLVNPRLQLFSGPTEIANNDDWGAAGNAAAIQASGFQPDAPAEPAIMMTLAPGAYTAIVSGVGGTTGVAIVEVFGLE